MKEEGCAAIHIDLTDGKITVRHSHNDGVILHHGEAQEGPEGPREIQDGGPGTRLYGVAGGD